MKTEKCRNAEGEEENDAHCGSTRDHKTSKHLLFVLLLFVPLLLAAKEEAKKMCKCGGADEHLHEVTVTKDLVQFIDLPKCSALNITKATQVNLAHVLKNDSKCFIESDVDDQLLVKVILSGNCKINAVAVQSDAANLKCFVNNECADFSTPNPQQEWNLLQVDSQMIEYPTKIFKFSNVCHLTLLFEGGSSKVYGIKLLGDSLNTKRGPVIADYELRPNVSDHKTGGLFDVESHNRL